MYLRTYQAVYDHGRLEWSDDDRPVERRARVMVTILEPLDLDTDSDDTEGADWHRMALAGLQNAFGPDEPEYTSADVKFR